MNIDLNPASAATAALQAEPAGRNSAPSSTQNLLAEFVKFAADPNLYENDAKQTERAPAKKKGGGGLFGGLFKGLMKAIKPILDIVSTVAPMIPGVGTVVGMASKAVGAIGSLLAAGGGEGGGAMGALGGLLNNIPVVGQIASLFGIGDKK